MVWPKKEFILSGCLVIILFIELFNYSTHPPKMGLLSIRESIGSIVKQRWSIFLLPKNNIDPGQSAFAKIAENNLPDGSKVLYVKDTNDGTDLRRYFTINYLMSGKLDAAYNFENRPGVSRIIQIMGETHSKYLITYANILPTYKLIGNDSEDVRGKIFELNGEELKLRLEYK